MTEADWLVCDDPNRMWWSVNRPSRRVAALFAVACVRATPEAHAQPLDRKSVV